MRSIFSATPLIGGGNENNNVLVVNTKTFEPVALFHEGYCYSRYGNKFSYGKWAMAEFRSQENYPEWMVDWETKYESNSGASYVAIAALEDDYAAIILDNLDNIVIAKDNNMLYDNNIKYDILNVFIVEGDVFSDYKNEKEIFVYNFIDKEVIKGMFFGHILHIDQKSVKIFDENIFYIDKYYVKKAHVTIYRSSNMDKIPFQVISEIIWKAGYKSPIGWHYNSDGIEGISVENRNILGWYYGVMTTKHVYNGDIIKIPIRIRKYNNVVFEIETPAINVDWSNSPELISINGDELRREYVNKNINTIPVEQFIVEARLNYDTEYNRLLTLTAEGYQSISKEIFAELPHPLAPKYIVQEEITYREIEFSVCKYIVPGVDDTKEYLILATIGDMEYDYHIINRDDMDTLTMVKKAFVNIFRKHLADLRDGMSIEEAIEFLKEKNPVITFSDSREVGNCELGTRRFLEKYNLPEKGKFEVLLNNPKFEEMLDNHQFVRVIKHVASKEKLLTSKIDINLLKGKKTPLRKSARR